MKHLKKMLHNYLNARWKMTNTLHTNGGTALITNHSFISDEKLYVTGKPWGQTQVGQEKKHWKNWAFGDRRGLACILTSFFNRNERKTISYKPLDMDLHSTSTGQSYLNAVSLPMINSLNHARLLR